MVQHKTAQRTLIERVFQQFNRHDLCYVVARKFERLPMANPDGDVDIFVDADDFDTAVGICERLDFEYLSSSGPTSPVTRSMTLLGRAAQKPTKAATTLVSSPEDIKKFIRGRKTPPHVHDYEEHQLQRGGLKLDFRNHLAYISPADGSRIRVDPTVERKFFDRRREYKDFYVPTPVDELTHIIAHCVFDKHGEFSEYYVNRCDTLIEEVTSNGDQDEEFRDLLGAVFYKADELVYELAVSGRYDSIRSRLYRFDEY